MYNLNVTLRPDAPQYPLAPAWMMRYSTGKMTLENLPEDMTSAVLVLAMTGASPVVIAANVEEDPPAITIPNGATQTAGTGYYYVYGFIGTAIYGLGRGTVNITAAPTLEAIEGATPVGNVAPIFNPTTGLYHMLTATANEYGEVTLTLAQEGMVG